MHGAATTNAFRVVWRAAKCRDRHPAKRVARSAGYPGTTNQQHSRYPAAIIQCIAIHPQEFRQFHPRDVPMAGPGGCGHERMDRCTTPALEQLVQYVTKCLTRQKTARRNNRTKLAGHDATSRGNATTMAVHLDRR